MSVKSVKWLLRLYPRAWRQRYEEEMLGLLELHHVTWRTRADLLRGALDAHVTGCFSDSMALFSPEKAQRLRHAHSTICWAFPLLVMGYLFFLDELDDAFYVWNRAHAALWGLKTFANALTALGFGGFLLTGLVLSVALAKQAMRQRAQSTRGVQKSTRGVQKSTRGVQKSTRGVQSGLLLALGACCLRLYAPHAALCLVALLAAMTPFAFAAALSRSELPPRLLNYALVPTTLAVLGMMAQVLFVAVWSGSIWRVSAPAVQRMAQAANRHLGTGERWHLQIVGGLLWMGLVTSCALWRWGRVWLASPVGKAVNGTSEA